MALFLLIGASYLGTLRIGMQVFDVVVGRQQETSYSFLNRLNLRSLLGLCNISYVLVAQLCR